MPRLFYGWYVVAASFFILFVAAVVTPIMGLMLKPMTTDFAWSRGATSSAIFLNMAVYAVSLIVAGRLYDRYGPRWLIPAGVLMSSAGFVLIARMDSLWELLLYYGVIVGLGQGATTIPLLGSVIGRWFEKWRGLAVSLAFTGFSLGQFVLIPILSDVITSSGWRTANLWLGVAFFVVGMPLALGIIRGDPPHFGLQPYGAVAREEGLPAGLFDADGVSSAGEAASAPRDLTLTECMRSRSLWLFTFVMFVCGGGDNLMITHLVPMVTDQGLSESLAASMLAWSGLLALAGVLTAGPAADRVGTKLIVAVTFGLRVLLYALVLVSKGSASFWVFSLLFGFTLLITAPLTFTLVGHLYGITHIGFIAGFINTVHMVGAGVWGYLGGVIFDRTGGYDLAFIISAALAGLAFVCALLIREEPHLPPQKGRRRDHGGEGNGEALEASA